MAYATATTGGGYAPGELVPDLSKQPAPGWAPPQGYDVYGNPTGQNTPTYTNPNTTPGTTNPNTTTASTKPAPTVMSSDTAATSYVPENQQKLQEATAQTPIANTALQQQREAAGTYQAQDGKLYYNYDATPVAGDGAMIPGTTTPTTGDTGVDAIFKQTYDLQRQMDATSAALMENIKQQYENLITEQRDINTRQTAAVDQSLLMGGTSRYAQQGAEGQHASIMSYGLRTIADLQQKENAALIAAQQASQANKQKTLDQQLTIFERLREEKQAEMTKLNDKIQAEKDATAKVREQADRDAAIAAVYSKGSTTPGEILAALRAQGDTKTTLANISDSLKSIVPAGLDDLLKTLRNNGAPADVIQKVMASKDMNAAYQAAGNFAAGGTGIIGEYNYYRAQAEKAGQVPVDFNTYQNIDANRKAKVAAAGVAPIPGSVNANGKYASDLDALVGNAKNTISSKFGQATFDDTISKARSDADKLNTVATIVLKNSPAPVREDFINQTVAMKQIDKAISVIDKGTKTGVINAAKQYVFNLAGKDYDPNLAAISAYLTSAVQPYRNSITGAAWGKQETQEYDSLFGSTKYSPTELKDRLLRVKEIMQDKTTNALNAQVNPLGGENQFNTADEIIKQNENDPLNLGITPTANNQSNPLSI